MDTMDTFQPTETLKAGDDGAHVLRAVGADGREVVLLVPPRDAPFRPQQALEIHVRTSASPRGVAVEVIRGPETSRAERLELYRAALGLIRLARFSLARLRPSLEVAAEPPAENSQDLGAPNLRPAAPEPELIELEGRARARGKGVVAAVVAAVLALLVPLAAQAPGRAGSAPAEAGADVLEFAAETVLTQTPPIPARPYPWQAVAPCPRPFVEINGGCWAAIKGAVPPCPEGTRTHAGECWIAAKKPKKEPRAGEMDAGAELPALEESWP